MLKVEHFLPYILLTLLMLSVFVSNARNTILHINISIHEDLEIFYGDNWFAWYIGVNIIGTATSMFGHYCAKGNTSKVVFTFLYVLFFLSLLAFSYKSYSYPISTITQESQPLVLWAIAVVTPYMAIEYVKRKRAHRVLDKS